MKKIASTLVLTLILSSLASPVYAEEVLPIAVQEELDVSDAADAEKEDADVISLDMDSDMEIETNDESVSNMETGNEADAAVQESTDNTENNESFDINDKDGAIETPDTKVEESSEDVNYEETETAESEAQEEVELEAVSSGSCGSDATWRLADNGYLYIEGSGAVTSNPWSTYKSSIYHVVIDQDITSLPSYAFSNYKMLISVLGGQGLLEIGYYGFNGCSKLILFEPANMTSLGAYSFCDCTSLTSFTANKVTEAGMSAFDGCTKLRSVSLPNLTTLNRDIFDGCTSLSSISMDSVTTIGMNAFRQCTSLTNVSLDKVTEIGVTAFEEASNLTSISFPSIQKIGSWAFGYCYKLEHVSISTVTEMGSHAFIYSGIKTLVLDQLAVIPDGAFSYCNNLTSVSIPGTTQIGKSAFAYCKALVTVSGLDHVNIIGNYAFDSCLKLTGISLNSINTIGEYAFRDCSSITKCILGEQISSIGNEAFWKCSSLKSVVIRTDPVYIGTEAFPENITIYGYSGSSAEEFAEDYCNFVALDQAAVEKVYGFVTRLYQVCLGRTPDTAGLNNWAYSLITQERTGIQTAYGFIFSNEFKNKNYCNDCYVEHLYQAFMGRGSDASGKASWIRQLESGKTREAVFNGFALSNEFKKICSAAGIAQGSAIAVPTYGTVPKGKCASCGAEDGVTAFVKRLYQVCFGRTADAGGLANWTNALWNHTKSGSGVAYGFIFSSEFQNKNLSNTAYVEYLYRAFFGREADAAGKANWVRLLNSGTSRRSVFNGFVGSQEFSKLCAKYGIVRD